MSQLSLPHPPCPAHSSVEADATGPVGTLHFCNFLDLEYRLFSTSQALTHPTNSLIDFFVIYEGGFCSNSGRDDDDLGQGDSRGGKEWSVCSRTLQKSNQEDA